MEDDFDEIYVSGLLDRYIKCFVKLEYLILVDWVVWYDLLCKLYVKKLFEIDVDDLFLEILISE